jgi:hypothetical protein
MCAAAVRGSVGGMFGELRKRWQVGRVRPGDGSALGTYRWWQLLSRSVFHLELFESAGSAHTYSVDVRHAADAQSRAEHEDGSRRSPAALYRDGFQVARSNLPAAFPVPGGVVEVASSAFGLKRIRYVGDDGRVLPLRPDRRSTEGRRAAYERRHPTASRVLGAVSLVVLLPVMALMLLQLAATLSEVPPVAESLGTFVSPVELPTWGNGVLLGIGVLAATERATRLRYHWLLDGSVG